MRAWPNQLIQGRIPRAALASLSFLGAFGFITDNLGHLSTQLNQVLALLLLLLFASLHLSLQNVSFKKAPKRLLILGAGSLIIFIVIWTTGGEVEKCLAAAFWVFSIDSINKAFGNAQPKLSAHLLATIFISLYVIVYKHVPPLWFALQESSQFYSHTVSNLDGEHLRLGATASGFHILIFFLIYVFSFFWLAKQRSWRSLAGIVALGVFANIFYLIVHPLVFIPLLRLFLNQYHLGHSHYHAYTITSFNTPLFFLALLAIPLFFLERKWQLGEQQERMYLPERAAVGAWLVFLGVFVLAFFPIEGQAGGKVLLYDKGYLNWDRPVFGQYGERSGGMFGMLPDFLEAAGFTVKRSSAISNEALSDCGTLVVINLQQPFAPDEHEAIWEFVKNGGSLLALGDHTGLAGIREPFNELLKPVEIKFNFDSAHYIKDWDHSFEIFPHPITRGISANRELGISVGASLNIPAAATPAVIGKYGFSDIGNANNSQNAFLGDRQYNQGELLGDIVLVAAARYGQGKVLVFGDTSSFQNLALVEAHRFVRRVFTWLNTSWPFAKLSGYLLLISVVLLFVGAGLVFRETDQASMGVSYVAVAVLLGLAGSALAHSFKQEDKTLEGNLACLDTSHLERVDLRYEADQALLGLSYNLMRNGFLPLEMSQFSEDQLRACKLFISIAPRKSFSSSEVSALRRFMADGGTFLLCTGSEEAESSQNVLGAFALGIEDTPLGPVEPQNNTAGVQFYNAWPARIDKPQTTEVLSSFKDTPYPMIVEQDYGAGRFILIGDAGFLGNANLESFQSYVPENITFLRELLQPASTGKRLSLKAEEKK